MARIGKRPPGLQLRQGRVVAFDPGPVGRQPSQGQIVAGLPTRFDQPRRIGLTGFEQRIEFLELGLQPSREALCRVELPFQISFVFLVELGFEASPQIDPWSPGGLHEPPAGAVRLEQFVVGGPREIVGRIVGHGCRIVRGDRPHGQEPPARGQRQARERERPETRVDRFPIRLPAAQVQHLAIERFGALSDCVERFNLNDSRQRVARAERRRHADHVDGDRLFAQGRHELVDALVVVACFVGAHHHQESPVLVRRAGAKAIDCVGDRPERVLFADQVPDNRLGGFDHLPTVGGWLGGQKLGLGAKRADDADSQGSADCAARLRAELELVERFINLCQSCHYLASEFRGAIGAVEQPHDQRRTVEARVEDFCRHLVGCRRKTRKPTIASRVHKRVCSDRRRPPRGAAGRRIVGRCCRLGRSAGTMGRGGIVRSECRRDPRRAGIDAELERHAGQGQQHQRQK